MSFLPRKTAFNVFVHISIDIGTQMYNTESYIAKENYLKLINCYVCL